MNSKKMTIHERLCYITGFIHGSVLGAMVGLFVLIIAYSPSATAEPAPISAYFWEPHEAYIEAGNDASPGNTVRIVINNKIEHYYVYKVEAKLNSDNTTHIEIQTVRVLDGKIRFFHIER